MRQLRDTSSVALTPASVHGEKVEAGPTDRSPIILFGLMFCAAVGAGYGSTLLFDPPRYSLMVVMAAGGASAAFLAFAIPTQTILFARKTLIRFGLALKRGRLHATLDAVHSALAEDAKEGDSASTLGDLALIEYLRGASEAAERDLARGLEIEPDSPALINNLGVVLADGKRYDRAAELFARAALAHGLNDARVNLGLVAPLTEDPEPLTLLVRDEPAPTDVMALNNIGVFHMRHGNPDLAAEWFARAIREEPGHAYARANMGLLSYRRDRVREAAAHLIRAARSAPADARIANNLGVVLARAGKQGWSHEQLARARALEPANIGIRINMMCVEALGGRVDAAMRGLRTLTAAAYHRADAYYNLAVLQLASGDNEGAVVSASAAVEQGEKGADAYGNLAVALSRAGREDEAVSHFQSANGAPDAGPRAASNLGRALMLQGDTERALATLEAAREKWRGDVELALDLATAFLAVAVSQFRAGMSPGERRDFFAELHRSYAGLDAATRAEGEIPPEAHVNMGIYFYLREEFLDAAEHIERAIKAAPDIVELRHIAGTAYGAEADRDRHVLEDGTRTLTTQGLELVRKAVPHLEAACEPRDSSPDAFYNLGRCLYALGEYERALEVFRKALRLEDSEEINTLAALAAAKQARKWQDAVKTQSLMAEGKKQALTRRARQFMDAAVQYFRQALLHNELIPSLHGNIGLAYMLRNQEHDVESALRHWQRMRSIAGPEMSKRFTELTQIQSLEHASRVQFDDSEVACREIDVPAWVSTMPPQPAGLHYVLEPVSEQHEWRLATSNEALKGALEIRDLIAASTATLARLEA